MANHFIKMSTVETMVVCKALDNFEFQNEVDKAMAERLSAEIKKKVANSLKVTDLDNKCGSCKWARHRHGSIIDCECPEKKPNWFPRTTRACKKYVKELKNE